MRRQQIVERCDRTAPRDVAGDLQPLRVLVEHRVDDVDEGLVAVEEAVPAGQEVALQPPWHWCSERTSITRPSGAWCSPVGRISASNWRSVTSNTEPSRFDDVSSGPKIRKVSRFRSTTSRRHVPSTVSYT